MSDKQNFYTIQQDTLYDIYTGRSDDNKQYLMIAIKVKEDQRGYTPSHLIILEFASSGDLTTFYTEALPNDFTFSNRGNILTKMIGTWAAKLTIGQRDVAIKIKPFDLPDYGLALINDKDTVKAFANDDSNVEPDDMEFYLAERERWVRGDSFILKIGTNRFLLDEAGYIVAI